jgi:hypothetical protein
MCACVDRWLATPRKETQLNEERRVRRRRILSTVTNLFGMLSYVRPHALISGSSIVTVIFTVARNVREKTVVWP